MQCLLDDASLNVGLVSLPFQQESEFYADVITPIFEDYIKRVRRYFRDPNDPKRREFEELYKPRPYYLFGRFDLAVLYIVDDHDFTCRTFRPFHPTAPPSRDELPDNFDYKVLFGPAPRIAKPDANSPRIIDLFKKIDGQPLLALTQLKINNSLLLGGGAALLRLVIDYIKQVSKAVPGTHSIILEAYAWHEVTLVTVGDAYKPMLDLAAKLRDASYRDILDAARRRADSATELAEVNKALDALRHVIGPEVGWTPQEVALAPVFGNITTNLGFDFELFKNPSGVGRIRPDDAVHVLSRWFIKPGKLAEFNKLVVGASADGLMRSVGRGDVWYPAHTAAPNARGHLAPPPTRDAITAYLEANAIKGLNSAAMQRYTHVAIPQEPPAERSETKRFSSTLKKLRFSSDDLKEMDTALKRLRVPKVLIQRLSTVYTNFNEGAVDRSLYASFAELRPFLDMVCHTVRREGRKLAALDDSASPPDGGYDGEPVPHDEICRWLRKWANNFERAYRNRIHNSERMGEVTDFNFEFKGGIQQVVTAFDSAYKALSLVLGWHGGFVSIGGDPGVESTVSEVRLNYLHVFQPEMFFAVAGKEASNWFAEIHEEWCADEELLRFIDDHLPEAQEQERRQMFSATMSRIRENPLLDDGFVTVADSAMNLSSFQTHLADLLTFHTCYAGHWSLFSHWMLGAFLQMAGAYRANGNLEEFEVARFLLRLRLIASSLTDDEFLKSIEAFQDSGVSDVCRILARRGQFQAFRNALAGTPLGSWFEKARVLSGRIAAFALSEPSVPQELTIQQQAALARAADHRDQIERGNVPRYPLPVDDTEDPLAAFRFCQQVLCGYLLLVKEQWNSKPPRLMRKGDGQPEVGDADACVLFDPFGGVFAHEPHTRRELFKYRSAVTMSLWDLGLKMKRNDLIARMQ